VFLDGVLADFECIGNLFVGQSFGQLMEDFHLARSEFLEGVAESQA
jgi:hypothetical protein